MKAWSQLPWLVLVAGAAWGSERAKVVVLDIVVTDSRQASGATPSPLAGLARAAAEQVMTELEATGRYSPMGSSDIASILGLERQRQLLGCDESATSCLAEISGALGAPLLVTGSLSRAGESIRLDLKLLDANTGRALARAGTELEDERRLFQAVSELVRRLTAPPGSKGPPAGAWVLLAGGAAVAITGAVLVIHQAGEAPALQGRIASGELDVTTGSRLRDGLYAERGVGAVALGVGAAAALSGVLWLALGGREGPPAAAVSLGVTPSGAALTVGGTW